MRKRFKFFTYKHPKTEEEFRELRDFNDKDIPYITSDGVKCHRKLDPGENTKGNADRYGSRSDREVFEIDPGYVQKLKPKYIKFRDGHREKYNPNKHN